MDTQTRQELERMRYVASFLTPRAPLGFLILLTQLLTIILGWYSVTLEVFIRKPGSFGERYLSPLRLFPAYMTLSGFTLLYILAGVLSGGLNYLAFLGYSGRLGTIFANGASGVMYHLYLYSFFGLAVLHLYAIWQRNRQGITWHSMSTGISWLEHLPWQYLERIPYVGSYLRVTDMVLYRFIEPGLFFGIGQLAWYVEPLLGWWLIIASVALCIKNNLVYQRMRGQFLDLMDANIEAAYLSRALKGSHKKETAGFSVIPVPIPGIIDGETFDIATSVRETLGLSEQPEA